MTYRVSAVLAWLATRHGEEYDEQKSWLDWLEAEVGPGHDSLSWVRHFAEALGPSPTRGVRFTAAGFAAYLASLGH